MPVYLCQPGFGANEPWRYGIQVYAAPFLIESKDEVTEDADRQPETTAKADDDCRTTTRGTSVRRRNYSEQAPNDDAQGSRSPSQEFQADSEAFDHGNDDMQPPISTQEFTTSREHGVKIKNHAGLNQRLSGVAIRRVRHAEVLLVDDVCLAFGRVWLRLRWPGSIGGFAGYIDWGNAEQASFFHTTTTGPGAPKEIILSELDGQKARANEDILRVRGSNDLDNAGTLARLIKSGDERNDGNEKSPKNFDDTEDGDDDDAIKGLHDNASTFSSEPFDSPSPLKCLRTGLVFPSSIAMRLLEMYDDGLVPPVTSAPLPSEPVFCRICREGLHDDADEQQPSPAMENDSDDRAIQTQLLGQSPEQIGRNQSQDNQLKEPVECDPLDYQAKGPVIPHPSFQSNPHAAENPILAPCECTGSMKYVHYLCVEQWRCRSRHPEAHNGLNCETCGGPYALPPPSTRPTNLLPTENDDWLDAMPPHVLAALRQPHFCWQVGAMVVQKRWLRPMAPVIVSPLVALYCRARRLLKKKGVARRRWACSLCRRRARWKCVRCLRSYYCSRHCQNVSWHIVHKYVCYKPIRWWWSVVVYGTAAFALFPGILRDPFMYDLGLGVVPASFYISAVLGGGVATFLKKSIGLDIRGRSFELFVILFTITLVGVTWGIMSAFFGDLSECWGAFGEYTFSESRVPVYMLRLLHRFLFVPAQAWFRFWDNLVYKSGFWVRKAMCSSQTGGCFTHLPHADADFIFDGTFGAACTSDTLFVLYVWMASGFAALGSTLWKRRERQRRALRRPGQEARPHQD